MIQHFISAVKALFIPEVAVEDAQQLFSIGADGFLISRPDMTSHFFLAR